MKKELPNLNFLRFILASFVVIYHIHDLSPKFGIPVFHDYPLFHKGPQAVFYFFTLSGFLIIRLLYIEKQETGRIALGKFYMRRILRIYPLYYLVLITGIVAYHIVLPGTDMASRFRVDYSVWELTAFYIFLMPNIFKGLHPEVGSILDVLWSIGMEEQFYLFIPLVMGAVAKKNIIKVLGVLLFGYLIVFSFVPRLEELLLLFFYCLFGGLVSIFSYLGLKSIDRWLKNGWFQSVVMAGFCLHFLTEFFYVDHYLFNHFFTMILSGVFIAVISSYPVVKIKNRGLNYLGKISYGIYMYHMIVISLAILAVSKFDISFSDHTLLGLWMFYLIIFVLVLTLSHVSFRYFETPFLALKNKFRSTGQNEPTLRQA